MVILPNLQDLSASSGLFNAGAFENIYHTFMDTGLQLMGRTITLHLPPAIEQDVPTQSRPQAQQVNPFFKGRVPRPNTNTRNAGTKITHRDVQYTAHIRIGPQEGDDTRGIGDLKENQGMLTLVVEALSHVQEALSISVEGRRYSVDETRPIGFSQRRYIMVPITEINEKDTDTNENAG